MKAVALKAATLKADLLNAVELSGVALNVVVLKAAVLNAVACALLLGALPVQAQIAGGKTIRLVIPFGTGGSPDILARMLAPKMAESLGQPVVVDNRPGATGLIAADNVLKATPDGTSIFVADSAHFAINPNLRANLPYDPRKDFAPVMEMVNSIILLAVGSNVPANNLRELVELAKSRPDGITYGSSGSGTPHHLSIELVRLELGGKFVHVPFKGVAQSVPAMLSGDVTVVAAGPGALVGHVKAGKARLISTINAVRWSRMPELQSFPDAGVTGLDATIGLLVPAATPSETVRRLNDEVGKAIRIPEIANKLPDFGLELIAGTPAEFAQSIARQIERYARLVKASGAKVD